MNLIAQLYIIQQFFKLLGHYVIQFWLHLYIQHMKLLPSRLHDLALAHNGVEWVPHFMGNRRVNQSCEIFLGLQIIVENFS